VGMAQIFSSIPGMKGLMSYWYHFAIMFEALFILTTIDAGTRIARFVLQEAMGKVYKPFGRTNWLPGNLLASGLVVFAWGYFIYSGSVSTIWPMFGSANQLLATIALVVGTSYIINQGKGKYAWITILPMAFVGITTLTAGFENVFKIYLPQAMEAKTRTQGIINTSLTVIIVICVFIILIDAIPKWIRNLKDQKALAVQGKMV
jgi:carbon starvation protein